MSKEKLYTAAALFAGVVGGIALVTTNGSRNVHNFLEQAGCKVFDCPPPPNPDQYQGIRTATAVNNIVLKFQDAVNAYRAVAANPDYAQFMLVPATEVPFDVVYPEQSLDDFHALVNGQHLGLVGRGEVAEDLQGVLTKLDDVRTDIMYARARKQIPTVETDVKPQP